MYIEYNPNPARNYVGDCTVRALSKALEQDWETTYAGLTTYGYNMCDMPNANNVWGIYLRQKGFKRYLVDDHNKDVYTVKDFCQDHLNGLYVLGISGHVVCVKDGDYYDS